MIPQRSNPCSLCATVSRANGEDPIGTARESDAWLVVERSQPWHFDRLERDPLLEPIFTAMKTLRQKGALKLLPMLVAPDSEYSQPSCQRIVYYHRPQGAFAHYEKQEFLVPGDRQLELVEALLDNPDNVVEFEAFRQQNPSVRDMMVCTHGNVDVACARFGFPLYDRLRKHYSSDGLRVWRCSHFGGHRFAPTLVDLPTGQFWGHLEAEALDPLIYRQGDVAKLRSFYRGWAGLSQFGQILERELWLHFGWEWLHYLKREISGDRHEAEQPDWVELRLEFAAPDGGDHGSYAARIESVGTVQTQQNSSEEPIAAKQYRVARCERY